MAHFQFVTVWRIAAPRQKVCEAVSECAAWPQWWRGVEKVEVRDPGDAAGLGSLRRFTWRGRLPYRLTFDVRVTRIVPLTLLEGRASGEVEGVGRWSFNGDEQVTVVRYEWQVRTNRRGLNLISALARPLIEWNHDQAMRCGAEGMARRLNAPLLSLDHG
jgi:hypothetical protein